MKQYTEVEGLMSQPQKKIVSSFKLLNGTLITHLLLFYLEMGLPCTKIYRLDEYTTKKCFNKFLQSAVLLRRQGDENPNSILVNETMKLLASSSCGYQIMDCSRHTVTKYLNDEKTHCAIKKTRSRDPPIVRSWACKSRSWTQRTCCSWVFQSSLCRTTDVGALLQFHRQVLWHQQKTIASTRLPLPNWTSAAEISKSGYQSSGESPLENYSKVLMRQWILNHQWEAFGQTITPLQRMSKLNGDYRLSYFYPKRSVEDDRNHTHPPNL